MGLFKHETKNRKDSVADWLSILNFRSSLFSVLRCYADLIYARSTFLRTRHLFLIIMMWRLSLCALEAHLLFLLIIGCNANAQLTTTTTTSTSTATFWTSTVTVTTHATHAKPDPHFTKTTLTETIPTGTTSQPSATMSGSGSGSSAYSGSELRSQVLNSTNYFRSQYEARALNWDPQLARYAQRYVDKCIWEHSVSHTFAISCTRQD